MQRVEHVMGMPILVDVPDDAVDERVVDDVFGWFRWVDRVFSTYKSDSEISRINRGELAVADAHPDVRSILAQCDRLRVATIAWSELLGELSAVGLRPYLELEQGDANDALRLYCELDDGLLVDLSIDDEAFPDAPAALDGDWVVFVEGHNGGYRAEVTIPGDIPFSQLARRVVDLTDAVALGEHPFLQDW